MAAGGLKQRLVGALVLVSAGIVLWSLLFTGPKVRQIDRETQIPAAPEKVVVNVPDPQPRSGEPVGTDLNSAPTVTLPTTPAAREPATEPAADAKAPAAENPPSTTTPALPEQATDRQDARGIPVAWLVVVGSFSDKAKADGIVTNLKTRNFKAYSDVLQRDGRTLYRVSIGPKLEKSQADTIKQQVDAMLKLNSLVRQFDVP